MPDDGINTETRENSNLISGTLDAQNLQKNVYKLEYLFFNK